MEVIKTHEVDASEKDSQGHYDYYYEFDEYQFKDSNSIYHARCYMEEPNSVNFSGVTRDNTRQLVTQTDIKSPAFKKAVEHLKNEGKITIEVLTESGYQAINI